MTPVIYFDRYGAYNHHYRESPRRERQASAREIARRKRERTMEKISIVKRRNDINTEPQFYRPGPEPLSDPSSSSIISAVKKRLLQAPCEEKSRKDRSTGTVEVSLSQDLTAQLRTVKGLEPYCQDGITAVDIDVQKEKEYQVVFRFHFSQIQNPKMLTTGEVCEMMRVSKSFLHRLVRQGSLKSYKVGRLRRFLVTHVFEYLSNEGGVPH